LYTPLSKNPEGAYSYGKSKLYISFLGAKQPIISSDLSTFIKDFQTLLTTFKP